VVGRGDKEKKDEKCRAKASKKEAAANVFCVCRKKEEGELMQGKSGGAEAPHTGKICL